MTNIPRVLKDPYAKELIDIAAGLTRSASNMRMIAEVKPEYLRSEADTLRGFSAEIQEFARRIMEYA